MDLFEEKGVRPMLLTEWRAPIESGGWISELKLDGIRCVAYLSPGKTDLRNKRNLRLLPGFPGLDSLHEGVRAACILDGELIIAGADGRPDFEALQERSMMSDPSRIRLTSRQLCGLRYFVQGWWRSDGASADGAQEHPAGSNPRWRTAGRIQNHRRQCKGSV